MSLREHYGIIAGLIEGESRPNSSQGLIINPSFLVVSDKSSPVKVHRPVPSSDGHATAMVLVLFSL